MAADSKVGAGWSNGSMSSQDREGSEALGRIATVGMRKPAHAGSP